MSASETKKFERWAAPMERRCHAMILEAQRVEKDGTDVAQEELADSLISFGRRTLVQIDQVRVLVGRGEMSIVAARATFRLGYLVAQREAEAEIYGFSDFLGAELDRASELAARYKDGWSRWKAEHKDAAKHGRKGGRKTSAKADESRGRIEEAALDYRACHPYNPAKVSQRQLAKRIAEDTGLKFGTVRGHLRALGIR